MKTARACIEISRKHLENNVRVLNQTMSPDCQLMAVLKREAYGHGACQVAECLNRMGVRAFAVATADEGIALREHGIQGEILILGYTDALRAWELKKYDLMQTVIDYEYAKSLNRQNITVKVHIKIDTGMHRLGIPAEEVGQILQVHAMEHLTVCGMYTHLSCADSREPADIAFSKRQIEDFFRVAVTCRQSGVQVSGLHIQSTYGFLNFPEISCDYVRVGLALYGVLSLPGEETVWHLDLQPVLSLKTKIVLIRDIKRGECFGYGRAFQADRDSRIAILPVGYGDGIPRSLSAGVGKMRIRGKLVPIVGRICMDQLAVDITDVPDAAVFDTAVLIEDEKDSELSAPAVAAACGSISNELLGRLGARLPVVVR